MRRLFAMGEISMEYKFIIWDWNGTLLDDVGAALASVNDMLERRGKPPIDLVRYRECIGVPIRKFYEQVFDLENEDYNSMIKEYNDGYARHASACTLSDGAREALSYFSQKGARQVIVSSSHNDIVKAGVQKLGIAEYFDEILGARDYFAASKTQRAVDYLNRSGAKKGTVLVVGDLEHDAETAAEIGADCVLLSTGHEKRERLAASNATVISSLRQLVENNGTI